MATPITYSDFAQLARRRRWSIEFLADHFRGRIEAPSEFFSRVMQAQHARVAIPYRSIIEFYEKEMTLDGPRAESGRRCACGCGRQVYDRKKWAIPSCKKRVQRGKSETSILPVASD